LHYTLEQRRATALVLAGCCVEAVANLYLAHKTTPEQFAILEWAKMLDKWTVLPSLFVSGYSLPKDGELYQDLKRLNARRNALVFIGRCRSLPERLFNHLASFDKTDAITQVRVVVGMTTLMREMRRLIKL